MEGSFTGDADKVITEQRPKYGGGMSQAAVCGGKTILGSYSTGNSPEAGMHLGCWRNAGEAGAQTAAGAEMGKGDEISRAVAHVTVSHSMSFGFHSQ